MWVRNQAILTLDLHEGQPHRHILYEGTRPVPTPLFHGRNYFSVLFERFDGLVVPLLFQVNYQQVKSHNPLAKCHAQLI